MSLLRLLIWKNFLIKWRHPFAIVLEIGIPCLFIALLAVVRVKVSFDYVTEPKIFSTHMDFKNYRNEHATKKVFYAPKNADTERLMSIFSNFSGYMTVVGFETEQQMEERYLEVSSLDIICGVTLKEWKNSKLDADIRFPFSLVITPNNTFKLVEEITWQTNRLFPMFQHPGPRGVDFRLGGPPSYYQEGFLAVQDRLALAFGKFLDAEMVEKHKKFNLEIGKMPYPPYKNDFFLFALQFFFPLIMTLSFIYPAVNLTKNIVLEKEQRFSAMASMMGLNASVQWIAHFINSFIMNIISVTIIVVLLTIPLKEDMKILDNSDPSLIFVWLLLFIFGTIMFCFMMSTFFSRANMAGIITGAIFFISFMPYYRINVNYGQISFTTKLAYSFIFNTNMSLGCLLLSMWESKHMGLKWSNLFQTASPEDDLTLFHLLATQFISSLVCLFVALYVSNVFPGEYGIPRKWYYFLTKSYWIKEQPSASAIKKASASPTGKTNSSLNITVKTGSDLTSGTNSGTNSGTKSGINSSSPTEMLLKKSRSRLAAATNILDISKSYDDGKTFSVKSLSLDMEQHEITVLLGHNGAGKTTLMSMLCGLILPTSGRIKIFGNDLHENIDAIRRDLGVCPQFDVLFDDLTVSEHLYFYCKLKGVPQEKINSEIASMIELLDLKPKADKESRTLSGGMKRKLSVGIALIGGSRFVLLDEATSGMDVSARRFIWDLLIKEKKNRVILLSTHFMEEADVLGDKIAIMEQGKLKCSGSPMELKKEYGLGYLLSIAVTDSSQTNSAKIHELIQEHINGAKLLTSVGTEITLSLPESQTTKFRGLFETIEKNSEKLNIVNFGISVTTIEEVFLRVGDFAKAGTDQFNEDAVNKNSKELIDKLRPDAVKFIQGSTKNFQIFKAMITKKLIFVRQNKFILFAQFILPALLLALSVFSQKDRSKFMISSPQIPLIMDTYKQMTVYIFDDGSPKALFFSEMFKKRVESVESGKFETKHFSYESNVEEKANNELLKVATKDEASYNIYHIFSIIFREDPDSEGALLLQGMFSNQPYHSCPTILSLMHEVLLKNLTGNPDASLRFGNFPFPRRPQESLNMIGFDSAGDVEFCNSLMFASAFLMASFVILIVNESITNFKHIQQISGLDLIIYWVSNFSLDYVFWIISTTIMALVVYLSGQAPYDSVEQSALLAFCLAIYGFAALPFVYFASFFVSDPATGYVRLSLYSIVIGTVSFITVLMLRVPEFDLGNLANQVENFLQFVLPVFAMPTQIYQFGKNHRSLSICDSPIQVKGTIMQLKDMCAFPEVIEGYPVAKVCCPDICNGNCMIHRDFLSWEKPGSIQFFMGYAVQMVLYWILLILMEYYRLNFSSLCAKLSFRKSLKKLSISTDTDSDVLEERGRIFSQTVDKLAQTDAMWTKELRKTFGNFTAVSNVSFGVKKAECFGILGVNGAGKTTTFKMITGAEDITSGAIFIDGMNVEKEMAKIYKIIGYCPQFDGLLEQLSGRQTLQIVSRIRGLQETLIDPQIDLLAKLLFFDKHIDKQVKSYSGGTKRKLSFAIAIVGNPKVVFLDEPTTGVDPVSRRCLWNAVQILRTAGSSVVLTSHSMEECEALCNRLIIMVNARIRCIGAPLHLKRKFGAGYIIQIKLNRRCDKSLVDGAINALIKRFGSKCGLESNHNNLLTFRLETSDVLLSELFGYIEDLKKSQEYPIEDYAISQTSLERIFLQFAREQIERVGA